MDSRTEWNDIVRRETYSRYWRNLTTRWAEAMKRRELHLAGAVDIERLARLDLRAALSRESAS